MRPTLRRTRSCQLCADIPTASEKCQQEKRKTVNGEDILFAMTSLGFENYSEALKIYLSKYREVCAAPDMACGYSPGSKACPRGILTKRSLSQTVAKTKAGPEVKEATAPVGLALPASRRAMPVLRLATAISMRKVVITAQQARPIKPSRPRSCISLPCQLAIWLLAAISTSDAAAMCVAIADHRLALFVYIRALRFLPRPGAGSSTWVPYGFWWRGSYNMAKGMIVRAEEN